MQIAAGCAAGVVNHKQGERRLRGSRRGRTRRRLRSPASARTKRPWRCRKRLPRTTLGPQCTKFACTVDAPVLVPRLKSTSPTKTAWRCCRTTSGEMPGACLSYSSVSHRIGGHPVLGQYMIVRSTSGALVSGVLLRAVRTTINCPMVSTRLVCGARELYGEAGKSTTCASGQTSARAQDRCRWKGSPADAD